MTPREQIIDAAKVHVATVRKSAADQIATAEEMEALVTNGLTERIPDCCHRPSCRAPNPLLEPLF